MKRNGPQWVFVDVFCAFIATQKKMTTTTSVGSYFSVSLGVAAFAVYFYLLPSENIMCFAMLCWWG